MSENPFVISFGEALWDVFHAPGGTSERRPGGAPANFAYHVAQLGVSACAVSAIGQDAAGEELEATLAAAGAPCALQKLPYATGEVDIVLTGAGCPHYTIRPDAAWDHLSATPELVQLARRAQALCFGSLAQRSADSRAALRTLLLALPPDAWRIFDVNLRCGYETREILQNSFCLANIVKLNEEEMEHIGRAEGFCGLPQLEQARRLMRRYGLRLLILTCGAVGSYVLGEGGQVLSWLASPPVQVVDTVGAGDSFTASFVVSLLRGNSVPEAHAAAVELASFVCTQAGAMPACGAMPSEPDQ